MSNPNAGRDPDVFRQIQSLESQVKDLQRSIVSAGGMSLIADVPRVSDALLSITNIPQIYSHLRLYVIGQSTRAAFANTGLRSTFNGLATAAYSFDYWGWNSTPAAYSGHVGGDTRMFIGQTPAGTKTSDSYVSSHIIDVPFYTLTNVIRAFHVNTTFNDGNTLMAGVNVNNIWTGTPQAVNRIDISDDVGGVLGPRTSAKLYGIL